MIFAQSIIFVLSFVNLAKACIETIVAYHISDFEIFLNFSKRPLLWTETWLAELPKVLNYFESHRQWVQGQTQDQSGSEFMPEEIHKCHTTLLNTGPITNQTIVSRQYYGQFLINAISKNVGIMLNCENEQVPKWAVRNFKKAVQSFQNWLLNVWSNFQYRWVQNGRWISNACLNEQKIREFHPPISESTWIINFRVVVCRIRLVPTLSLKKWLRSEPPLKICGSQYHKSYDIKETMHQNKSVCLFQNNLI